MPSNHPAPGSFAVAISTAQDTPSVRKHSYSRRRWNAFEAWQEHVRRSAAAVGGAFTQQHDRDLRRALTG
jgi:hypothetical protein